MTSVSKSSAYPKSVQPGIPSLRSCPAGWTQEPLGKHLTEQLRPIRMVDDQAYDLVTVKRSRGGVVRRERLLGREISVKSQFLLNSGDFLISKRQIVHGACGIVPRSLDGSIVSNEYTVLTARPTIDLQFLNYLAHSTYFQQTCFHSSIGVHVEKMIFKMDRWFKWKFNLPPLAEQKRIAEIISTWDQVIEKHEQLIANTRSQKQMLAQQLLTGKQRLKGFSADWELNALGSMAELTAGGTPSTNQPCYWGGEIPWMSSGEINLGEVHDVEGRISEAGLRNSSTKILPINSVLVALAGQGTTRGKVAISRIPLCTNQSVAAIIPGRYLSADFLYFNLGSRYDELRSLSLGDGGRGGLNLALLKKIQVPVPPLDEQIAIASILKTAEMQVKTYERKRDALVRERSALLQQLITGKRRVTLSRKEAA